MDLEQTPASLGVSILGGNFMAHEDLECWQDENNRGWGWYSMRPHCRVRRYGDSYGLDEAMWVRNFSKPGATLAQLGMPTWLKGWVEEGQLITILELGMEDVLSGSTPKEDFKKDPKLLLKMVRKAILNLVEMKTEHIMRVAPGKLKSWKENHHFGIYSLPNLEGYPFEGTGWTFLEYVRVSRKQNHNLKNSRDQVHLKYTVLSPDVGHPRFGNRKKGAFPGFPYMKLEKSLMKPFVKPILDLVRKRYCSRCREPSLPGESWRNATVDPADGRSSGVHCLPPEIWGMIFGRVTVFDEWTMKETCKGLYRIHHESPRCMRELELKVAAEGN